jgi:hypothetical protein
LQGFLEKWNNVVGSNISPKHLRVASYYAQMWIFFETVISEGENKNERPFEE